MQVTHVTEKTGEKGKKIRVRENTRNLEISPKHRENTRNLVCSSCKFTVKDILQFATIISKKYFKLDVSAKSVLCM